MNEEMHSHSVKHTHGQIGVPFTAGSHTHTVRYVISYCPFCGRQLLRLPIYPEDFSMRCNDCKVDFDPWIIEGKVIRFREKSVNQF